MVRFRCKNCNYIFNSESSEEKKVCQYCGKKEAEKEMNAEELIKDA